MRVKHANSVFKMLDERYQVDRGGGFKVSGYTGSFRFSQATVSGDGEWSCGARPPITHDIFYCDMLIVNEKNVRVTFSVDLNHKRNWWELSDASRTSKALRETKEYQNLKMRIFAQFILWCIEDDSELLEGS